MYSHTTCVSTLQTFIISFSYKSFQLVIAICTTCFICETEMDFLIVEWRKMIEKYNNNKNKYPYILSGESHKSNVGFDKTYLFPSNCPVRRV